MSELVRREGTGAGREPVQIRRLSPLLTVRQVADQIGVHYKTACDLVSGGVIPAIDISGSGTGRRYRIRVDDLERWLESRQTT